VSSRASGHWPPTGSGAGRGTVCIVSARRKKPHRAAPGPRSTRRAPARGPAAAATEASAASTASIPRALADPPRTSSRTLLPVLRPRWTCRPRSPRPARSPVPGPIRVPARGRWRTRGRWWARWLARGGPYEVVSPTTAVAQDRACCGDHRPSWPPGPRLRRSRAVSIPTRDGQSVPALADRHLATGCRRCSAHWRSGHRGRRCPPSHADVLPDITAPLGHWRTADDRRLRAQGWGPCPPFGDWFTLYARRPMVYGFHAQEAPLCVCCAPSSLLLEVRSGLC